MFNFLTEKVRTAPIVTSVVIPGGSRTRVIVPSMLFKKKLLFVFYIVSFTYIQVTHLWPRTLPTTITWLIIKGNVRRFSSIT
jgi:hypothetical protein